MFRMCSEERAESVHVPAWIEKHGEHEHSVKWPRDGYSVYMECFDCGIESAESILLMNDAYREARMLLSRDGAAVI